MLGMHLIFSTYGFWPPNDPRGSGSTRVRAQHVFEAGGPATKVHTTHSLAGKPHNLRIRHAIKESLKFPPVTLTGLQAQAVGQGFASISTKIDLMIHACAILPDHVHVVVARHRLDGDEIIVCLKRAGTRAMNEAGLHPLAAFSRASGKHPCPWGGGGWKVFLNTPEEMRGRIRYVEENPVEGGVSSTALVVRGAVFGVVPVGGGFIVADDAKVKVSHSALGVVREDEFSVVRAAVVSNRVQTRPLFHQFDDRIDFRIVKRRHVRLRRPAGDRVDLHQLQFAARRGDSR